MAVSGGNNDKPFIHRVNDESDSQVDKVNSHGSSIEGADFNVDRASFSPRFRKCILPL
jgi:hypothetical protein